jgi:hypothetical protein
MPPPSIASTSSRRDKYRPGCVRVQLTDPYRLHDSHASSNVAVVAFRVKTRANAREFILSCRSELRDGTATFDVVRKYEDFVRYVLCASRDVDVRCAAPPHAPFGFGRFGFETNAVN